MFNTWHQKAPDKPRSTTRTTRHGCVTCKRRRVRCDQTQPTCGSCVRLKLDCSWKSASPSTQNQSKEATASPNHPDRASITSAADATITQQATPPSGFVSGLAETTAHSTASSGSAQAHPTPPQSLATNTVAGTNTTEQQTLRPEEMFDFASFLWAEQFTPSVSEISPPAGWWSDVSATAFPPSYIPEDGLGQLAQGVHNRSNDLLIERFRKAEAPPILAHVESRAKWNLIRDIFLSMASTSNMVHHAVVAFSSLQMQQRRGNGPREVHPSYMQSQHDISYSMLEHNDRSEVIDAELQHVLAAIFLLSYIDLVTGRTESAHAGLRRAFKLVSGKDRSKFNATEKILVSWIRLLDARAVSAGGEGLFLQEEEPPEPDSGTATPIEKDVESIVSELLLKPSQQMFQKTQYFMGRITKIDRWHRGRDTVEDESEVMIIAAQIKADIQKLYLRRHPMLDLAVTGKLESSIIADSLAKRITRSSRVALANYHASYIHLHRVAYRHLLRTKDVCTAIETIRQIAHSMVSELEEGEILPVNMLWPLLMWASEEDSVDERVWILATIRAMSDEFSNAAVTANVLQEVMRRQDATGQRTDIRAVMHDICNSCFAIV